LQSAMRRLRIGIAVVPVNGFHKRR
jgi:hypothetical protein